MSSIIPKLKKRKPTPDEKLLDDLAKVGVAQPEGPSIQLPNGQRVTLTDWEERPMYSTIHLGVPKSLSSFEDFVFKGGHSKKPARAQAQHHGAQAKRMLKRGR